MGFTGFFSFSRSAANLSKLWWTRVSSWMPLAYFLQQTIGPVLFSFPPIQKNQIHLFLGCKWCPCPLWASSTTLYGLNNERGDPFWMVLPTWTKEPENIFRGQGKLIVWSDLSLKVNFFGRMFHLMEEFAIFLCTFQISVWSAWPMFFPPPLYKSTGIKKESEC